jgi:hypothetical protein
MSVKITARPRISTQWLLLLCSSPLNSLFAYLYQAMLIVLACFGLLVVLPVLVPDGWPLALRLLGSHGWFGERALWRALSRGLDE